MVQSLNNAPNIFLILSFLSSMLGLFFLMIVKYDIKGKFGINLLGIGFIIFVGFPLLSGIILSISNK